MMWDVIVAWLVYIRSYPITISADLVLYLLMVVFFALFALPDNIVGGKLFGQRYAWVVASVGTGYFFITRILPVLTWELVAMLIVMALLLLGTFLTKNNLVGGRK